MVSAESPADIVGEGTVPVVDGSYRNRRRIGQTIDRSGGVNSKRYLVSEIDAKLLWFGLLPMENDSSVGFVSALREADSF